jgi:hypothetical protein
MAGVDHAGDDGGLRLSGHNGLGAGSAGADRVREPLNRQRAFSPSSLSLQA